jgi:hypothetical protein
MKKLMISGVLAGFLIGLGFGLVRANSWPVILGRSTAALFCSGMLMRWWAQVWLKSLRDSYAEQYAAACAKTPPDKA